MELLEGFYIEGDVDQFSHKEQEDLRSRRPPILSLKLLVMEVRKQKKKEKKK